MEGVDIKVPAMGRQLLERYSAKELTEEEFDTEIVYWMLSIGIQHMRWRKDPVTPDAMSEYYERKDRQPDYVASNEFWRIPEVAAWQVAVHHNLCENRGNWYWLNKMLKVLPMGDIRNRGIVKTVMESYEQHRPIQGAL